MNDQNRYEEVPQKENKFKKGMKSLGSYFKFVFVDFFNSFKYNNMKLAAILFAMPGILLGFFMFAHVPTIRHVTASYRTAQEGSQVTITAEENVDTTDDRDYYLTVKEYTINGNKYNDIVLELQEANYASEDEYPVDGTAGDGQTTQLSTPVLEANTSLVQRYTEDSDGNKTYSDSFDVSFTGISDTEASKISKYMIFIYKLVNGKAYYTGSPYSLDTDSSVVTITGLNEGASNYLVAIKAVALSGTTYYSSNVSEPVAFTVNSKSASYNEADTQYIQFMGDYAVKDASNDDLAGFKVSIDADGSVVYTDSVANKSVEASLSGAGLSLSSVNMLKVNILPFDFSGICIFFLTLFGFLNVFLSLDLSKKKNFGTVIKCTLTTVGITALAALYIFAIFRTESFIKLETGGLKLADDSTTIINSNAVISMTVVILSVVFSLAGLVLAFINYDRTYEKVDR